jgi:pilus assembly protein Flp/PilA
MLQPQIESFRRLLRDTRAASAIEYAMIAAGISVAIVATVTATGASVKGMYESIKNAWPS